MESEEEDTVGVVLEDVSEVVKRFLAIKKAQKEFRNFEELECEERENVPVFALMANEDFEVTEDHSYSAGVVDGAGMVDGAGVVGGDRMVDIQPISLKHLVPFKEGPNIPNSQRKFEIN
ncbi:uncharacterized protein [Drosophila takahashii]|uniref:uncharacterized protein n=1 Tax=Drosophila takahashii TaxID=29030 RepID=UPI00389907EE